MIKTSIVEADGEKYIIKTPMNNQSCEYVQDLTRKYNVLSEIYSGSGIVINRCVPDQDGVRLDYVQGTTFEELLDEYYIKQEYDKLLEFISLYKQRVIDTAVSKIEGKAFVPSDEFVKVFGGWECELELAAVPVADIDMIFSNIIVDNDGNWNIIDYEWSFDFEVPANFVLYRALVDYLYKHNKRDSLWELDVLSKFCITKEEQECYARMDTAFHEYVKGKHMTLQELNESIGNTRFDAIDFTKTYIPGRVQVFLDKGDGYSEENSCFVNCAVKESGDYELFIGDLDNTKSIRIDPTDTFCVARIIGIQYYFLNDEIGKVHLCNNGVEIDKDTYVYNTDDPQWVILNEDNKLHAIKMVFDISNIDSKMADILIAACGKYKDIEQANQNYENIVRHKDSELKRFHDEIENRGIEIGRCHVEIDRCNQVIAQLEEDKQSILNSTSWKLTAPLRKLKGNK